MPEPNETIVESEEDQGTNPNPEETEDSGEGNQSNKGGEGAGEGGEAPQTLKVGEKEYTPKEIEDLEKKGRDYDSLLPDYTQKSQKLSEFEKQGQKKVEEIEEEKPPYYDPDWKPKDYKELSAALKMAEERGEKRALTALQKLDENKQQAKTQLEDFIKDVKTKDAEFDEQDFYDFASKHDFTVNSVKELKSIYSVYKESVKPANKPADGAKPRKDAVGGKPSGGSNKSFAYPTEKIRGGGSASEIISDAFKNFKK